MELDPFLVELWNTVSCNLVPIVVTTVLEKKKDWPKLQDGTADPFRSRLTPRLLALTISSINSFKAVSKMTIRYVQWPPNVKNLFSNEYLWYICDFAKNLPSFLSIFQFLPFQLEIQWPKIWKHPMPNRRRKKFLKQKKKWFYLGLSLTRKIGKEWELLSKWYFV